MRFPLGPLLCNHVRPWWVGEVVQDPRYEVVVQPFILQFFTQNHRLHGTKFTEKAKKHLREEMDEHLLLLCPQEVFHCLVWWSGWYFRAKT